MSESIKTGVLGLGRSGWDIHIRALKELQDKFTVTAVYDLIEERVTEAAAELDCHACSSESELMNHPEVDLLLVSTYNDTHAMYTQKALQAGKNVICEKPFGLTYADTQDMIQAAQKAGKLLFPFQQRRYEEDFLKVKEIIESGLLGDIVNIRICWHGFKRRWDWQTSRERCGGALNNNGPHPLDHAMILFGADNPEVWGQSSNHLCSGDAEDHLKFILTGEGHPTVEVELTDVWAYNQDRWTISGTKGGLKGNSDKLEWKWVDFSSMPDRPLNMNSTPDRSYNSEELNWQTAFWEKEKKNTGGGAGAPPEQDAVLKFYHDVFLTLTEGKPQVITPESVSSRVAVMEKIRAAANIPC